MTFACGLEGSEAGNAEALESQIMAVIQDIADNGVAEDCSCFGPTPTGTEPS